MCSGYLSQTKGPGESVDTPIAVAKVSGMPNSFIATWPAPMLRALRARRVRQQRQTGARCARERITSVGEPSCLWLTLLIDAYSRSILGGIALTYEGPSIDTIQDALLNAIWPKTSHAKMGIEGEWPCYGIPLQLSLDNAWSKFTAEESARTVIVFTQPV